MDINQFASMAALSLSQAVIDSVDAGASELRQQISYDPSAKIVHVVAFEAAHGAPMPTTYVSTASTLWSYDIRIDEILLDSGQPNSVVMTGAFLTGQSPIADLTSSSAVISFVYADVSDGTATFRGISVGLVGAGATFSSAGAGRIGVSRSTVTAVASPRGAAVTSLSFALDGRKSTSSSGGALTYQWQFLPAAGQTVQFTGEDSAVLQVTLQPDNPLVFGDYTFRLTVKNAAGVTASDTVTITVINPAE